MSSASTPGAPPSRAPLVIILAVIGILAIIAGILYVSGAANSLHFMDGARHKGHHEIRAIVSFVVGIAFLVGAFIAARSRPAAGSRGSTGSTGSAASSTGSTGSAGSGTGSADSASGSATPSGT
jgi:hypothetical protein